MAAKQKYFKTGADRSFTDGMSHYVAGGTVFPASEAVLAHYELTGGKVDGETVYEPATEQDYQAQEDRAAAERGEQVDASAEAAQVNPDADETLAAGAQ